MDSLKQPQIEALNQQQEDNDIGIKYKKLDQIDLANCVLYKCMGIHYFLEFSYILSHLLKVITKNEQTYRYKMHLGLCKMMEFNELELVYWHLLNLQFDYGKKLQSHYLQEIKYFTRVIRLCAFNFFKDFLKIQAEFIPDIALYKRELLFVTLSAFYTIKVLRNIQKFDKIGEFIKEELFGELFKRIEPAFQNVSQQLTLYIVNQKYMELTKLEEPIDEQQTNYNFIVEQILEMAPAYQKDEELPITKKVKRQKKLMMKRNEPILKAEPNEKIEPQQQQSQQQQEFQPLASLQFSRQFTPVQQVQQQIQDPFLVNERSSFQQYDRQNSFGMQLRSRFFNNYSQESLGQVFSHQFLNNPEYQSRNMKSSQWTNKNGK